MRRLKLSEDDQARLISMSDTGVTDAQLSVEFSISRSTVERYKHPSLRELSRETQRLAAKRDRLCFKCGFSYDGHPKCSGCQVLIHSGLSTCGDQTCIDTIQ